MKAARVTVPATAANLGPGFDTLAMALSLRNTIEIRPADEGIDVQAEGAGAGQLPTGPDNLIAQAAAAAFDALGQHPAGFSIRALNRIPMASGLGSSAAAIVGGLMAADALVDGGLGPADLLGLAAKLEGHADNAAAALLGGLVLVRRQGDMIQARSAPVRDLQLLVVVPDLELSTAEMRRALPQQVPLEDAAANVANLAFLLEALRIGDLGLLADSTEDHLHEPHRIPLIKGAEQARRAGLQAGAVAVVLSGAGPGMLAFCDENQAAVSAAMVNSFAHDGIEAQPFALGLDRQGAKVEILER